MEYLNNSNITDEGTPFLFDDQVIYDGENVSLDPKKYSIHYSHSNFTIAVSLIGCISVGIGYWLNKK